VDSWYGGGGLSFDDRSGIRSNMALSPTIGRGLGACVAASEVLFEVGLVEAWDGVVGNIS
jgi:hypothetical protein